MHKSKLAGFIIDCRTDRVHLDIEADDVEAEVLRLQALGAKRLHAVKDWVVMEAPTGQRFCVVPEASPAFARQATTWP